MTNKPNIKQLTLIERESLACYLAALRRDYPAMSNKEFRVRKTMSIEILIDARSKLPPARL
jgi:hypothetical protein